MNSRKMITSLELYGKALSQFEAAPAGPFVFGLKKVNLFIGINNSGKSRFLRSLFEKRSSIRFFKDDFVRNELKHQLISTLETSFIQASDISKRQRMVLKKEKNFREDIHRLKNSGTAEIDSVLKLIAEITTIGEKDFDIRKEIDQKQITEAVSKFSSISQNLDRVLSQIGIQSDKLKKLYVPILRGLRPIQFKVDSFDNTDSYLQRTKNDYFQNQQVDSEIFTGLSLYEDVMRLLLGTEEERKTIAEFENFLSERVFFQKVNLIPKYKDDVLHIKLGKSKQTEIYNLGDGLQTIITILFPIFLRRDEETLVFIEEPEAHLHPEWQILLINALKSFDNHQFFISTHSASFINDLDSSIYLVKRTKRRSIITFSNLESQKVDIIKDLGYKPSDLFMTNYILWVEGQSDKVYFEYWLNKYAPDLIEGQHYSIMFYGGDNYQQFLSHAGEFSLGFIKKMNQNFGIVLDSDRTKKTEVFPERKKKIKQLFENDNSFCWLTKYREIENYIPLEAFKNAIKLISKRDNIEVPSGNYDDRFMIVDHDAPPSFRSKIQLPQDLFRVIQKNKDGSTKGIPAKELRSGIEEAIQKTRKKTFGLGKIGVAKKVVELAPEIQEKELQDALHRLIGKIKEANNM